MRSTFTWLDYSEHERRKMVDVIEAFAEQGTRDELGIGTIRDGFADLLFPGTGTVQTRAKYFLFIPWIYLEAEERRIESARIADWARRREIALVNGLEKGGETLDVIGRVAREGLRRLPSNIYWQGLGVWGIRLFEGSQDQYHRSIDRWRQARGQMLRSEDGDVVSGSAALNWHSSLPPQPEGFPDNASFALCRKDAKYLQERILTHAPRSLLAHFVARKSAPSDGPFCWTEAGYADFPPANREQVDHARCFSEVIHGAALLYNLMLSQLRRNDELINHYVEQFREWSDLVNERGSVLHGWNQEQFWQILHAAGARVPSRTERFTKDWVAMVLSAASPGKLAGHSAARQLVKERERALKKSLARLENPRALELWNGAAGAGRLDFRWGVSRQIVTDVMEGLNHA
jgi:hypothetical protein